MSERQDRYLIAALLLALLAGLAVDALKKISAHPAIEIIKSSLAEGDLSGEEAEPPIAARKIDINLAPLEELMKLKGVGRVLAQRIIDYRSSRGPFNSPEELKNVKGLSRKIFLDNRDRLVAGEAG